MNTPSTNFKNVDKAIPNSYIGMIAILTMRNLNRSCDCDTGLLFGNIRRDYAEGQVPRIVYDAYCPLCHSLTIQYFTEDTMALFVEGYNESPLINDVNWEQVDKIANSKIKEGKIPGSLPLGVANRDRSILKSDPETMYIRVELFKLVGYEHRYNITAFDGKIERGTTFRNCVIR